jgi:hypothetical protein
MSKVNRSHVMWAHSDVFGLFSGSVVSFSIIVGSGPCLFSANVGWKLRCSRAEQFMLLGHYKYRQVKPASHDRVMEKCKIYGKLWGY